MVETAFVTIILVLDHDEPGLAYYTSAVLGRLNQTELLEPIYFDYYQGYIIFRFSATHKPV